MPPIAIKATLQRRADYLHDESHTKPQRMTHAEAKVIAEAEIQAFAAPDGLNLAEGNLDNLAVELHKTLTGWSITWAHEAGALVYVASNTATVLNGEPTVIDAYHAAMGHQLKRNAQAAQAPAPTTTRYPTLDQRREANAAMNTFAVTHKFREYGQPESGGNRVIVRPTGDLDHIEISWEWDGKSVYYFARDRNDGSVPTLPCASPEEAFDEFAAYANATKLSQHAKIEAAQAPEPTTPAEAAHDALVGIFSTVKCLDTGSFLISPRGTPVILYAIIIKPHTPTGDHILRVWSNGPAGGKAGMGLPGFDIHGVKTIGCGAGDLFSVAESRIVDMVNSGTVDGLDDVVKTLLRSVKRGTVLHEVLVRRYGDKNQSPAPAPPAATPFSKPTARPRVYVCHEYSADPEGNAAKVAVLCKGLVAEGVLPIAPQVYLAAFVDDATQRELAMSLCLDLLAGCDELLLCGPTLSAGMIDEVRFALERGIPIRSHRP